MGASLVSDMIGTAALLTGDPNKSRTTTDKWLAIYNLAVREMCTTWRMLKGEWKDDLNTSSHYCTYPDDMTVLTGVAVFQDATDLSSRRNLIPFENEDAFRRATYGTYIQESLPSRYYADAEVIYLYGQPITFVTDGLRLEGFARPALVASVAGALYEPPDLTADLCLRKMMIINKRINKQYAEASAEDEVWAKDGAAFAQTIEARGAEQRTIIRPSGWNRPFGDAT